MYYDKLNDYGKIILKERRINIFMLAIWAFPIPFLAWATHEDFRAVFFILALLIPILILTKLIVNNNRLLNQFSSIEKKQRFK